MNSFVRGIIKDTCEDKFLVLEEERNQNIWNFPGGKIEFSETSQSACIREIYEETSLQIFKCKLLFQQVFCENGKRWLGYYYWVDKIAGEIQLREKKCSNYRFITLSEIVKNNNIYIYSAGEHIERIMYG